jgi:hypothetical protein
VKILLGSHVHGDHQEGDALVKQLMAHRSWRWRRTFPRCRS